jgi:two-component system sensor histidine kinase KdpD
VSSSEPRRPPGSGRRLGAARWPADAAVAAIGVGAVTGLGRLGELTASGAGILYVLAVLLVSVTRGLASGLVAAAAAVLALNYFFVPPLHTFAVDHPENWLALGALAVTSVVGSRLISAAHRRAVEAAARRAEVEMLYELCFGLLTADATPGGLRRAAGRALEIVGARGGGILLRGPSGGEETQRFAVPEAAPAVAADRPEVAAALAGELVLTRRGARDVDAYVPLRLGRETTGVFVALGTAAPERVLEPAGRLLAIAFEREKALAEAARLEALRQSDTLKTALLRAVSHDLRSPLTALAMEVDALRRGTAVGAGDPHLLALERDTERLARRIDNLLTLARLESGVAQPRAEAIPAGDLLRQSRDALAAALAGRRVEARVAADTPDVLVDPALGIEIVVNLLENAARATPPGELIELVASPASPKRAGDALPRVCLEVRDRGPGLPPEVALRHGPASRREALAAGVGSGLGLEIARSLAEASAGELSLEQRDGGGAIARVLLPAAPDGLE